MHRSQIKTNKDRLSSITEVAGDQAPVLLPDIAQLWRLTMRISCKKTHMRRCNSSKCIIFTATCVKSGLTNSSGIYGQDVLRPQTI